MTRTVCAGALALGCALLAGSAAAHVTLQNGTAPSGGSYRAALQVGHGCAGSPTTAIRVQIPPGVIAVKPMPKTGWDLTTRIAPYDAPVDYYGSPLTEGVAEIAWTGGNLPDDWYDEFIFRAVLPAGAPGTVIRFPVVQECVEGVERWIEIPQPGEDADAYESPAPGVALTEAAPGH